MELASFAAMCQIFAADRKNYRKFIELIPELAKELDMTEHQAICYVKHYYSKPIYVYTGGDPPEQDETDLLRTNRDFFTPLDEKAPESVFSKWTKVDRQAFIDIFATDLWGELEDMLQQGAPVRKFQEVRERMCTLALECIGNHE